MGLSFTRRIKTSRNSWLNVGTNGVNATARLGKRVTVNSRGGIRVRLGKGLSWRIGR